MNKKNSHSSSFGKKIEQSSIYSSIRKPMPPPSKVISSKKDKNKKNNRSNWKKEE